MPDKNLDENAAEQMASNWAISRGRPPAKFQRFAIEHLRKNPNINSENLKVNMEYFDLATEEAKNLWLKYCHEQTNWSGEWMLETVKHLAIINAAGIAGAATLLATQNADGWVKLAFCLFTGGLLLAVLDLWLCACGFQSRSDEGGVVLSQPVMLSHGSNGASHSILLCTARIGSKLPNGLDGLPRYLGSLEL
ncbi:hypothetical protein [Bordetella genomosp. 10]|uniref:hypothetical protein n=1 Tax=Bordetella genomosp. 10 TaxID=1416804 RepID=UPI0011778541|nr:hypothetical protein [Bordetella genomosp. 10]